MAPRTFIAEAPLVQGIDMTGRTSAWGVLEVLRAMTRFASGGCVQADEREPRQVVVERHPLPPAILAMACLTPLPEATLVRIALAVTSSTIARQLDLVLVRAVATRAGRLGMLAPQGKAGVAGMVELCLLPACRLVTSLAARAVLALMRVVEPMTADASRSQPLVDLVGMARRAGDLLVRCHQRKPRLVVIERLRLFPARGAMARLAGLAEPPLVAIVAAMAIDAAGRRVTKFLVRLVTAGARCACMSALEDKVGQRVIERLAIQTDDVEVPALVVRVAVSAGLPQSLWMLAVETALGRAIRPDRLVTVEAEVGLRLFAEGLVARVAGCLELGMSLDQRSRHDQALEQGLPVRCCRDQQGDCGSEGGSGQAAQQVRCLNTDGRR